MFILNSLEENPSVNLGEMTSAVRTDITLLLTIFGQDVSRWSGYIAMCLRKVRGQELFVGSLQLGEILYHLIEFCSFRAQSSSAKMFWSRCMCF